MTFPTDAYTPYGYLHSPDHRAHSWQDASGGMIRTSERFLGMGWAYVHPRRAVFLCAALELGKMKCHTRADWAACGLHAAHHSSEMMTFRASPPGCTLTLTYFRLHTGILAAHATLHAEAAINGRWGWLLDADRVPGHWRTMADRARLTGREPHTLLVRDPPMPRLARRPRPGAWEEIALQPGEIWEGWALLANGSAPTDPRPWWQSVATVEAEKRRADDAFWSHAPRLTGDWPDHWRRGWVYDMETTRLLIQPPGGVFSGEWPTWMVAWPRAVLAEGALDLDRLGLADATRAQDTLATLLGDTPGDQVPCVFRDGEPNMVAADGAVCGTSPAWCLPVLHSARLLRRQPDPDRIARVAPLLARYLRWWLIERTDHDGWLSYHCTWEAGEDDNPRLDPNGTGDGIIQGRTRPVELQAAMALSAGILRDMFQQIGVPDEAAPWDAVAIKYAARVQQLWDGATGRFRDWDVRANRFIEGSSTYWETDPNRFSPLSLAPALLDLTEEQRTALRLELAHYDTAPWRWWPSWSGTLGEVAAALGCDDWAARFVEKIVDRVYRENDRRTQAPDERPTPGGAREYWPEPLNKFTGNDAYGWGAETLPLLLRHIVGFREDDDGWYGVRFTLVPGLPEGWRGTYTLANLQYRAVALDLTYTVTDDGPMTAQIISRPPLPCRVTSADGSVLLDALADAFVPFPVRNGERYVVSLGV
ncbi:MAG: hypothetical protein LC793_07095 [Thermomicrobia bacterium]|nr:hypothetical protein [Thermomicrobia bacterium]MCA1723229.1 hypothetical protein [Thermomicrobia bacterium]